MKAVLGFLAGAALMCGMPGAAHAQERNKDAASAEETDAVFADLTFFELDIDPLTDVQEARLPAAERVALQLMPEGSFKRMMSDQLMPVFESALASEKSDPREALTNLTGLPSWRINALDDDAAASALAILDPNQAKREAATFQWLMGMLDEMFTLLEPHYRAGMAQAIAVEFTAEELEEMEVFFATPAGARYATNSYLLHSSPHVLDATNQIGPLIGQMFPRLMEEVAEIEERYGSARSIGELPADELSKLAGLFGISSQQLLSEAAEDEEEIDFSED
ncbi:hypothetical protein [Paraurantiacibacter namhicola]|uniref:DUF2059 domain-containing protein n=1 Tax=Paraurantiacibacter namhicola TaxID=645517 RepID=A0A1C7D5A3_9SPHN|nr:hypothetical protein [Paraurantiacibacter namhicola]ANU06638.1 hypothetical protein A6F65_00311 [Paraurantiacibacter namhicola]